MTIILYLLSIPFFYFNYKIIISDIKEKKIPNRYLLYLLILIPFFYINLFFLNENINFLYFFIQILLTFIVSFILYYFWIRSAWDSKYLLVLSLFIPNIWVIPLIWNLSLLTLSYLFIYFLYFYFFKCLFIKNYAKGLYRDIKNDLNEKWITYRNNKWWKSTFIIIKWISLFLLFFVSMRLIRYFLINSAINGDNSRNEFIKEIIEKYNFYLVILIIIFLFWSIYLFRLLLNKFRLFIVENTNLKDSIIWKILIIIAFFILIAFIIFEYINNPFEIKKILYLIFTLYIFLWIAFKILFYSYKITFWISELDMIDIWELKVWDLIDKVYLLKLFWQQKCLWFEYNNDEPINKKFLYIEPDKYFMRINKVIDQEEYEMLKKVYKTVNDYHIENNTPWFQKINKIKVLKTFSFWPYIFFWFIVTYFFQDNTVKYLINLVANLINNFYK